MPTINFEFWRKTDLDLGAPNIRCWLIEQTPSNKNWHLKNLVVQSIWVQKNVCMLSTLWTFLTVSCDNGIVIFSSGLRWVSRHYLCNSDLLEAELVSSKLIRGADVTSLRYAWPTHFKQLWGKTLNRPRKWILASAPLHTQDTEIGLGALVWQPQPSFSISDRSCLMAEKSRENASRIARQKIN